MVRSSAFTLVCMVLGAELVHSQTPTPAPTATEVLTEKYTPAVADVGSVWRVSGGASLITIVPRFESNPAFTSTTIRAQGPGQPNLNTTTVKEFDYDYSLSPRVWLAVDAGGAMGARVRWWNYHQSAPTITFQNDPITLGSPVLARTAGGTSPLLFIGPQTNLPAAFSVQQQGLFLPGDTLTFTTKMAMNVWDFEATYADLSIGSWKMIAAGGFRYASIEQQYTSASVGIFTQSLVSDQSFKGVGPSVAIDARRPIADTGFAFVGGVRGALLFGKDKHTQYGRNVGLVPPFNLTDHQDSAERQRMLPSIESEMGVEYSRLMGRSEVYFQGGVVAQLWPSGSGANGNGNMGLLGYTFNTGVRY